MTDFKSGDLVVLKSGGPTMTVDSVNTSIFDDNKITGIVCVWFVGDKLERVRFEHGAIEFAQSKEVASKEVASKKIASRKKSGRVEEASGDYKVVLDEMVVAMNTSEDAASHPSKTAVKQPKTAQARKHHDVAGVPVANGNGAIR
jgi:uncharacterized protein YodC (DUF2158 family)